MWIIGKASPEEVEEMKKLGFEVQDVELTHFDQALDPKCDPTEDTDLAEYLADNGDLLVGTWLDYDIAQECRDIIAQEDKPLFEHFDRSEQLMLLQLALDALDEQSILDRNDISEETAMEVWKKLDRLMNSEKTS